MFLPMPPALQGKRQRCWGDLEKWGSLGENAEVKAGGRTNLSEEGPHGRASGLHSLRYHLHPSPP